MCTVIEYSSCKKIPESCQRYDYAKIMTPKKCLTLYEQRQPLNVYEITHFIMLDGCL
jgi:hypothetical protein